MKPTSAWTLVALALLGGAVGYLIGTSAYGDLPPLPVYPPLLIGVVAVVELGMAKVIRDRLAGRVRRDARPLHPEQVARAAVLAKASSPTGALLAGGYAGLAVYLARDSAPAAADDRPIAIATVVAAVVLVAVALWLERSCRVPDDPDGPEP